MFPVWVGGTTGASLGCALSIASMLTAEREDTTVVVRNICFQESGESKDAETPETKDADTPH